MEGEDSWNEYTLRILWQVSKARLIPVGRVAKCSLRKNVVIQSRTYPYT